MCLCSYQAESVWLREASRECGYDKDRMCVCVLGVTDHSPALFQGHTCPGRSNPCWGQAWQGAKRAKGTLIPGYHQVLSLEDGGEVALWSSWPPLSHPQECSRHRDGRGAGRHHSGDTSEGLGYKLQEGLLGWRQISNSEHWLHN